MHRLIAPLLMATIVGCTDSAENNRADHIENSGASSDIIWPVTLFAKAMPQDAKGLKEAKAGARVGQHIVIHGRIGGSVKPFSPDMALFLLIDSSLPMCHETSDSTEACSTPFDCCHVDPSTLAENMATIQVVDIVGAPIRKTLDGTHGLKPGSAVVVSGVVDRYDGQSLLIVNANSIHLMGVSN